MSASNERVALITGGSRGLGLGIAQQLAADGFNVAINGRRPSNDVAENIERLRALGGEVEYFRADVSDAASRQQMVDELRSRFGRINVLVNNAGVAPDARTDLLDASEESFDRVLGTNLKGPYFLTQLIAKWMIEQRQASESFNGNIVNVSSVSAELASINRGDYCISKAGVSMATKLWAMRLAEYAIQVYEVRPGIFQTDMTASVKEDYERLLSDGLALESRWGDPAELGRAVSLLVGGKLSYATGNVLRVDGGMTLPRL